MICPYCQQPTEPISRPDDGLNIGQNVCKQHPGFVYLSTRLWHSITSPSITIWLAQMLFAKNRTLYSLEATSIHVGKTFLYREQDPSPILTLNIPLIPEQAQLLFERCLNLLPFS